MLSFKQPPCTTVSFMVCHLPPLRLPADLTPAELLGELCKSTQASSTNAELKSAGLGEKRAE